MNDKQTKEEKVDNILTKVVQSKYSVWVVAAYTLFWYLVGFYVGDLLHFIENLRP